MKASAPKKKIIRPRISKEKREALRAALAEANSRGERALAVASAFGVSPASACALARSMGLRFPRGRAGGPSEENQKRIPLIVALYRDGYTLEQIGAQYGITRERVRQILKKRCGLVGKDGGANVRGAKRSAERKQALDSRCLAKHGCSFEQYRTIRGARGPVKAFTQQRTNARRRGIEWKLKAWEWWTIWQESGHWAERGRGQGYVMSRVNDEGPYAVGNVFIARAIENNSKTKLKKSGLPIGVHHIKRGKYECYTALRMLNGKKLHLGSYKTPELAHAAYLAAAPTQGSAA